MREHRPEVGVALLTPYAHDGTPDLDALAAHVQLLVDSGIDALMPCGTNGEGPLLSDDEIVSITAATVEACAGRARVIAHAGRPATGPTVALAVAALAAGAHAVSEW